MNTFLLRFSIKDADGQHKYDYSNDFLVDLTDEQVAEVNKLVNIEREKLLFKFFKEKIKQAVVEWFNTDPEAVRDDINQYGYCDYDYENRDDEDQTEAEYAVDQLPARCVAHIPDAITNKFGFCIAPEPSLDKEFYNDFGFLNDDE